MNIDDQRTPPDDRPEPYSDSSAFPWMGYYPPVPVERFPSSTSHHPIVYEGFVPDDEEMLDESYGIGSEDAAGVHTGEASQFGAYGNNNYYDQFNSSDGVEDSESSGKDGNRQVTSRSLVLEVLLTPIQWQKPRIK